METSAATEALPPSGPYSSRSGFTFSRDCVSGNTLPKLHLPNWTLIPPLLVPLSTTIEFRVHLRRIRFVVYDAAVDFDPGVRLERHLLCAEDHLRRNSVRLEQAGR